MQEGGRKKGKEERNKSENRKLDASEHLVGLPWPVRFMSKAMEGFWKVRMMTINYNAEHAVCTQVSLIHSSRTA